MPSLKDIRKRIASVKSTRKITSAMKMVAAAKLRRAQEAAEASRPYALKMNELIKNLSAGVDANASPLFRQVPEPKSVLIVVIASDRGLCGGYNSNLLRAVKKFVNTKKLKGAEVTMLPVGRKAKQAFKPSHFAIWEKDVPKLTGNVNFKDVHQLAQDITVDFLSERFDEVFIAFNEFISAIQYEQRIEPMLPLSPDTDDAAHHPATFPNGQLKEYKFEPDKRRLLENLLPQSISIQLLTSFYESEASEHSARMSAMDSATTNASEMIDSLTLEYNRARQAYITRELVEIVSGAEALNG